MYLNNEILEKYNACERGKAWFQNNCKDGAELSDIITNIDVPRDMLYWAKQWLNLNDEEVFLYNKYLKIEDSYNIFNSYEINNSNNIINSHAVKDSTMVKYSDNVVNGNRIYNSTDIKDCVNVTQGIEVRSSNIILGSTNVSNSFEIIYSSDVENSRHIDRCDMITNSQVLRLCKEVDGSMFSSNLDNCSNCIFCYNLTNKNNYIFNTKMPEETVAIIKKVLSDKLHLEVFKLVNSIDMDGNFDFNQDSYNLSDEFYKWAYDLIHTKEDKSFILAQITLLKNWKRKFDFK